MRTNKGFYKVWLAIETSSAYMGVALWQPEDQRLFMRGEPVGRGMAAALHPLLQGVFSEAQASVRDLQGIVVNRGPGSFTSIRLGMATAQGLALPWHTPIYGLDAFNLAVAPFLGAGVPVTVWIKAKAHEVYTRLFSAGGAALSAPACMTLDEARASLTPSLLVGNGVPLTLDCPSGVQVPDHPHLHDPDMAWMVRQGPVLKEAQATDLTPHYIRPLNYRTLADVS